MRSLKTILLALLLCIAGTLSAQRSTVQREVTDDYVKITRIIPNWDSKHDLRIGIGGISLCALGYLDEGFGMVDYDAGSQRQKTIVKAGCFIAKNQRIRRMFLVACDVLKSSFSFKHKRKKFTILIFLFILFKTFKKLNVCFKNCPH